MSTETYKPVVFKEEIDLDGLEPSMREGTTTHPYTAVHRLRQPAHILSVAVQHGTPCVWFIANPPPGLSVTDELGIVGTGHTMNRGAAESRFVGTLLLHDGDLVLHAFAHAETPPIPEPC